MTYRHKLTTDIAKIIGSCMMMFFALVAFAHGQNCTLLPWWNPSVLIDGQSKTGYQVPEATFTQSCTGSVGVITCISGSIANGNVFKYQSCIPHTRANCTTPTWANHLEYRTLYKLAQSTYTQTCQQLSQNLQCLNGIFTWWITPNLFTHATCVDPNRTQCIDVWTNSYKDHGEMLVWYTANHPSIGQMCSTMQKTLTCTNGTWAWNGTQWQAWLVTGCTNPPVFSWCLNIRTNTTLPHWSSLGAYLYPSGICSNLYYPLLCINGLRSGGNQISLYSWCANTNTQSCPNIITNSGTLPHLSVITKYSQKFAFGMNNDYCSDFAKILQCTNGIRSGNVAGLFTWCLNIESWACLDTSTNIYTPNLHSITKYTIAQATSTQSCEESQVQFTCVNSVRSGGNPSSYPFSWCWWCKLPSARWVAVSEWRQGYWYSVTWAIFPKTCNDYSTLLSCTSGILNGNRQTYKYPSSQCQNNWALVTGIDLAIDWSPGIPGQENISGAVIAQWSSPQMTILIQNKWTDLVNQPINTSGFLTCRRAQQNLIVYTSKPITNFVVNPGTKVGVSIRIKSLFTQALGTKTLICKIDTSLLWGSIVGPGNDTRSGTFEIVQADRFDLALSKSIQTISQNLEAAEWAKGVQWVQNFLYNKIMNVLVPLIVIIGILSAILWFYKIMFSSEDAATKEWVNYIIYWVIGIIVIMSAKFIGQNIFDLLNPQGGQIQWYTIASGLYDKVIYPFIKFAIYLVLGAMFIILISRVITFLFGSDTDAQKKAWTLIWWNIVSMLIIIWAKQIVEAIYGKQDQVVRDITNLGDIGSWILADRNIPILYQVINYALGIASLVILVIIIIQTIQLLTKPDDPAQIKSIKNSLLYMLIGILILGAGYLIVNFAIIN